MSVEEKLNQANGAIKEDDGKVTDDKKTEKEGAAEKGVSKVKESLDKHEKIPSTYELSKEFNKFKRDYDWLVSKLYSQRATKHAIIIQLDEAISKFIK